MVMLLLQTLHHTSATIDPAIPPVLHGVIATSRHPSSDLGPASTHIVHVLLNPCALFGRDRFMVERRLQVLMIALSTLFRRTRANGPSDSYPIMRATGIHQVEQAFVFFLRPWPPLDILLRRRRSPRGGRQRGQARRSSPGGGFVGPLPSPVSGRGGYLSHRSDDG